MQIVSAGETRVDNSDPVAATVRQGKRIKQGLLRDDTQDGLSFTLSRTQWLPGEDAASSPRHRHAFQQIRWTESGRVNFGPDQFVEEGDFAYFPRGSFYGPQHREEGIVLTLQFGFNGEKQHGVAEWEPYREPALENLKARGRFEEGQFVEVDPDTGKEQIKDGLEALYEEQYKLRYGEEFVLPDPGYEYPVLVHTGAFSYFNVEPSVQMRRFGAFYDHPGPDGDVRVSMLRFEDGGSYSLGADRAQVAWAKDAGLVVGGKGHPELTFVYSELGEELTIGGSEGIEVAVVEFPLIG